MKLEVLELLYHLSPFVNAMLDIMKIQKEETRFVRNAIIHAKLVLEIHKDVQHVLKILIDSSMKISRAIVCLATLIAEFPNAVPAIILADLVIY